MSRLLNLCVGGVLVWQCVACTVPPLSHATNNAPFGSNISVDDVVRRVKCELADALLDQVMEQKKVNWIESWTAKADLTLQVNEAGGITPNVSFIQPLHNTYNLTSGPSSVGYPSGTPGTSTSAISQSFNLGIGAVYSGQVFRTETVSFTLSLKELKNWRKKGRGRNISCAPVGETDLQGDLNLKPWLEAALVPVEAGDLSFGIHPAPGTQVKSASGGAPGAAPKDEDAAWTIFYQAVAKNAKDSAVKSAQQAWATARQAARSDVLRRDIKDKIFELANSASKAAMYAALAEKNASQPAASKEVAQENAVYADKNAEAAALDAAAANLAANPNPPIDSVSHSLNFIVTTGASVSPNWALAQWKGPANIGNLASFSGVRTHTLNIALGAPAITAGSQEATRVLNNDAFRQAVQSPF